ncbi:hypothetical protein CORC01_03084 [Colletotrichum orchidophilum]|uniref:Uncharacterized protein n=1 Tax=Colletotrichum orchidophilum TaxID=1209926 RepID=A0A1G4BJJ7_9PEZI|nr:uncharacterized protein CORC01_03084 [Colletotrichum orchidophilum]OHF01594.1 hypothetical protein CORC01_03084 [Colletotrichum orchidophilum]
MPSPSKGRSPEDGFLFVPITHPSESKAWKKKVRSHAARNPKARQQRVAAYQQSTTPPHGGQLSLGQGLVEDSPARPSIQSVRSWLVTTLKNGSRSGHTPLLANSPISMLGAARTDPFNTFVRRVTIQEQGLLDHFLHSMALLELIRLPDMELMVQGERTAFCKTMTTYWVQSALSDPGMLSLVLLWSMRHLATVREQGYSDPMMTMYKMETIRQLNASITREGNNISNLTMAKSLCLASDANLVGEPEVAEKHMKAVERMALLATGGMKAVEGEWDGALNDLTMFFSENDESPAHIAQVNLSFKSEKPQRLGGVARNMDYVLRPTRTS